MIRTLVSTDMWSMRICSSHTTTLSAAIRASLESAVSTKHPTSRLPVDHRRRAGGVAGVERANAGVLVGGRHAGDSRRIGRALMESEASCP